MVWSFEDKEVSRLLSLEGNSAREISAEVGIPEETIKKWRVSWGHRSINNYAELYKGTIEEVQQRLIKIMQESPIVGYSYFNSKDSNTPAATTYRKYFGSWEAALAAAGRVSNEGFSGNSEVNKFSMKPDRATTLYLVEFDEFYKVGITQQTIHQRLGNRYGKYSIIMQLSLPYLEAKTLEANWLKVVKPYQFIPQDFPVEGRGFTECFKF